MKFTVKKIDEHKIWQIYDFNYLNKTGLLNEKESLILIRKLIISAEDLMPDSHSVYKACLANIREDL